MLSDCYDWRDLQLTTCINLVHPVYLPHTLNVHQNEQLVSCMYPSLLLSFSPSLLLSFAFSLFPSSSPSSTSLSVTHFLSLLAIISEIDNGASVSPYCLLYIKRYLCEYLYVSLCSLPLIFYLFILISNY